MIRKPAIFLCTLALSVITITSCKKSLDSAPTSPATTDTKPISIVDSLKLKAETGDIKAEMELGSRYEKGDGLNVDMTKAFEWYEKSALGGNPDAFMKVADFYQRGVGVKRDSEKVSYWRNKALENGNSEAQYQKSLDYCFVLTDRVLMLNQKDDKSERESKDNCIGWLEKSSDQNYLPAKHDLGMLLMLGVANLIDRSITKGSALVKSAADEGYWESQHAMAVLYQSGYGEIKADAVESDKYWSLLNSQSDPEIQYKIGSSFYDSSDKAAYKDGKHKYNGRRLSFTETNQIAAEWYEKAAAQNHAQAMINLSHLYRDGRGVYADERRSSELLLTAANLGNYDAQRELAYAYIDGRGVVKNYEEALKWLSKAANENDDSSWSSVHQGRNALGALYEFGWGVEKNPVTAYAWYNIAAAGGYQKAKENLARVEKALNAEQLKEAQKLSGDWHPGTNMSRGIHQVTETSIDKSANNHSLARSSIGTGFFLTPDGYLLTNNHVISGCTEIHIPSENLTATQVVADQANDLALIRVNTHNAASVTFPDSDELKQGEEVFAFGYPLDGFLPSSGNITPGLISALSGPSNNATLIQITAPVQPGNSGGPLINNRGKIVGVVVGKADAIAIANVTGDIPQNINYAISLRTVRSFLDANRVAYRKKSNLFSLRKENSVIADEARKASVKIECWR